MTPMSTNTNFPSPGHPPAGLFNVAELYHERFPGDSKIVMTAGSTDKGGPAKDDKGKDLHTEHHQGQDVDLRYMGSNGKPIQGPTGAARGDVQRNDYVIDRLSKSTLTGNPSKYGTVPIRNPDTLAAHQNHMHLRKIQ